MRTGFRGGVALVVLAALAMGCDLSTSGDVYGKPLPFATGGAAGSNACGLLSQTEVYSLFRTGMQPPFPGSETQPPNCTWTTVETVGSGQLTLEVAADASDVALARQFLADGSVQPVHLGLQAGLDPAAGRLVVLLSGGRELTLLLQAAAASTAARLVPLAAAAVRRLGARRPAPTGQQLLPG